MKKCIQNTLQLLVMLQIMAVRLVHQRKFIKQTIGVDIEEIKKNSDGSLRDSDFRKITHYYAYAVPAILGESFSILRGKPLTIKERLALTYLGAASCLFDDFFDEKNTPENRIRELLSNPAEIIAANSHELLFVRFYLKVLNHAGNSNLLMDYANQVFEAQVLSKKQRHVGIERDEIKSITLQKGGFSFLLYRSMLDGPADEPEEQMIYCLGGLFQLENDLFDIYKDYASGIRTLATTETKIGRLRQEYTLLTDKTMQLVRHTNYPESNQTRFIRFISLVLSRGFVCLDKLEKNEKRTDNIFSIEKYERNDLICDMEKISSNIRLLRYYFNRIEQF